MGEVMGEVTLAQKPASGSRAQRRRQGVGGGGGGSTGCSARVQRTHVRLVQVLHYHHTMSLSLWIRPPQLLPSPAPRSGAYRGERLECEYWHTSISSKKSAPARRRSRAASRTTRCILKLLQASRPPWQLRNDH